MSIPENPFVFGEIIDEPAFVDRTSELNQLVRDLADGQKVFLLSPRRFLGRAPSSPWRFSD